MSFDEMIRWVAKKIGCKEAETIYRNSFRLISQNVRVCVRESACA